MPWEHREIIQIGAIKLDLTKSSMIIDSMSIIVRPGINNKLSSYITKLTGITQGQVDGDGVDFIDALGEFYKFAENGKLPTCSYGNDFEVFCENARLYNVPLINFSGGMFNIIPAFQNAKN